MIVSYGENMGAGLGPQGAGAEGKKTGHEGGLQESQPWESLRKSLVQKPDFLSWLHWVFIVVHGLSLVVTSVGFLHCLVVA